MINEIIIDLIDQLKLRSLDESKMNSLAECFLKVALAETGEDFKIDDLIKRSNSNPSQTKSLINTAIMTAPKLAHIMLGCQTLLADSEIDVSLEEIEKICKLSKQRSLTVLMPPLDKPKSRWKPMQ